MSNEKDLSEMTSPKNIARDIFTSVLLLIGAWLIEWSKSFFPEKIPIFTSAILVIGDITLLAYFLGTMFRAILWSYKEFDATVISIKKSETWKQSKQWFISFITFTKTALSTVFALIKKMRKKLPVLIGIIFFTIFVYPIIINAQLNISCLGCPSYEYVEWVSFLSFGFTKLAAQVATFLVGISVFAISITLVIRKVVNSHTVTV